VTPPKLSSSKRRKLRREAVDQFHQSDALKRLLRPSEAPPITRATLLSLRSSSMDLKVVHIDKLRHLTPLSVFSFNPEAEAFVPLCSRPEVGTGHVFPIRAHEHPPNDAETSFWLAMEQHAGPTSERMWCCFEEVEFRGPHSGVLQSNVIFMCAKCGDDVRRCSCDQIFCRRCMRCAVDCLCTQPWTKIRVCAECLLYEQPIELHGKRFHETRLEPTSHQECQECGCREFRTPHGPDDVSVEYYCLNSAYVCVVCRRVDAQDLVEACEGKGCRHMFHTSCVPCTSNTCLFCPQCISSGVAVSDDDGDDSVFSTDEGEVNV
jgi:hypothetical protein